MDQLVETCPVHPGCFPTSTDQPRDSKNSRKCGWTILEDSMFFRIWNNQQKHGMCRGSWKLLFPFSPCLCFYHPKFCVTKMVLTNRDLQEVRNPRLSTWTPVLAAQPSCMATSWFLPSLLKPGITLLQMVISGSIHTSGVNHRPGQCSLHQHQT